MLIPAAVVVGAQCGQKRTACCDATPSTANGSFIDKTLVDLHTMRAPKPTLKPTLRNCDCMFTRVRVRLKKIGNLETMHDSDLHTFLIISSPIIFKRTVVHCMDAASHDCYTVATTHRQLVKACTIYMGFLNRCRGGKSAAQRKQQPIGSSSTSWP